LQELPTTKCRKKQDLKGLQCLSKLDKKIKNEALNALKTTIWIIWLKNHGQNPTKWTQWTNGVNVPKNGYKRYFEKRMSGLIYSFKGTYLFSFS